MTESGDGPAPDVSVSIVNTSNRDLLLACLESLESDRDGPVSVDVTVLDNASEDRFGRGGPRALPVGPRDRAATSRRLRSESQHGHAGDGRALRLCPERGRHGRARLVRAAGRLHGLPPGGGGSRAAYSLSRTVATSPPPGGFPRRRLLLSARSRSRVSVSSSPAETSLGGWTGSWAARSSCGGKPSTASASSTSASSSTRRRLTSAAGWPTRATRPISCPEVTVYHHVSQFSADVPERRINEEWRSRAPLLAQASLAARRARDRASDRPSVRRPGGPRRGRPPSPGGPTSGPDRPGRARPLPLARTECVGRGARPWPPGVRRRVEPGAPGGGQAGGSSLPRIPEMQGESP